MQLSPRLGLLLAFCCPAPSFGSQTLFVPSDHPNLAAAIAHAQPGDEIVVQTNADQNQGFLPIVIDKPLEIRGEPVCNVLLGVDGLLLDGPGSGKLVLENVHIGYAQLDSNGKKSLSGGGFDQVFLRGCTIRHDNVSLSGLITTSEPAIDLLDVEQLILLDCNVLGGKAGADSCLFSLSNYQNGKPGIFARNSQVVLIDSQVRGGIGGASEFTSQPCPGDLTAWPGKGGIGAIARQLILLGNSSVAGGAGASWSSFPLGICNVGKSITCGTQPNGSAALVSGLFQFADAGLLSDQDSISFSAGGVQELTLISYPSFAGASYFVLGSLAGSSPGTPIGPYFLPLVISDPYFLYTVQQPNGPVLGSSLGVLDAKGSATATVTITDDLPSALIGLTLTHACVLFGAQLEVLGTSNAVSLAISS